MSQGRYLHQSFFMFQTVYKLRYRSAKQKSEITDTATDKYRKRKGNYILTYKIVFDMRYHAYRGNSKAENREGDQAQRDDTERFFKFFLVVPHATAFGAGGGRTISLPRHFGEENGIALVFFLPCDIRV